MLFTKVTLKIKDQKDYKKKDERIKNINQREARREIFIFGKI